MADRPTSKLKNAESDTSQALTKSNQNASTLNVQPLPNNRPIAANVTESNEELMGYLD